MDAKVDDTIALVLAIARLGENDQAGWWRCHGLSSTGRYVLSTSFPRTWRPAALELDVESATRRQNDLLGRPTALHLFSDYLPFRREALAWLAETKTGADSSAIDDLEACSESDTRALIKSRCRLDPPAGEDVGAGFLLGSLGADALKDDETLTAAGRSLASCYINQGPDLRPPYFDLAT